jgi:DNA-binding GntR family transcriptional regulator
MGCVGLLLSAQVSYGVSMIDYDSPVAPYRQVAGILRARIESGDLGPGSRLPSIATLTQEYGVARTTAAKALRLLVDEGLAEMSPGMGTFVTAH